MKITKVDLREFIESLLFAYNRGADFADIIFEENKDRDSITINVLEEYMCEEEDSGQFTEINDMLLMKLMN